MPGGKDCSIWPASPVLSATLALVSVQCHASSPVAPPKPCPRLAQHPWLSCPWFPPSARLAAVARVCLDMLLPRLPLVYSFGFFSLNSIAYRRVIRVCQYEVGDDLSGRFFSSYSLLPSLWFYQCTLDSQAALLSNPHPSHLGGGPVPLYRTGPAFCPSPRAPFSWGTGCACESHLLMG